MDGRLRVVAMAGLLVVAGACSGGGGDTAGPTTATTATTVAPATTATTVAPATTATTGGTGVAGEVTVRGAVTAVFASARVLRFEPPLDGYSTVVVGSGTEFRKADGSPGSLQDVGDGSQVEVTGDAGEPGTLLARRVVVLG